MRKWTAAAVAAVAGAALVTACGSPAASAPAAGGGPVPIAIGVSPSLTSAPLYLAQEQGFFAEEGLEVDLQVAQSGAATIPQLLNGGLQFSISDTVATINAVANDVPLRIVAVDIVGGDPAEPSFDAVVSGSVPAGDATALAGRTVAVNQLKGLGELLTRAVLDGRGVDPDGVEFVEVPYPDMQAALEQDRVDAAYLLEPFLTSSTRAGLAEVFSPTEVSTGLPTVTFSTSAQYAAANPDVVERFVRAVARGTAYAAENPDAVRTAAASFTTLPPEVLAEIRIPTYAPDARDTGGVGRLADLMVRYGFLPEAPPAADYVGPAAG